MTQHFLVIKHTNFRYKTLMTCAVSALIHVWLKLLFITYELLMVTCSRRCWRLSGGWQTRSSRLMATLTTSKNNKYYCNKQDLASACQCHLSSLSISREKLDQIYAYLQPHFILAKRHKLIFLVLLRHKGTAWVDQMSCTAHKEFLGSPKSPCCKRSVFHLKLVQ